MTYYIIIVVVAYGFGQHGTDTVLKKMNFLDRGHTLFI